LWPQNQDNNKATFFSIHYKYGREALLFKERPKYDVGAYQNGCYNMLPSLVAACGKVKNKLVNEERTEMI